MSLPKTRDIHDGHLAIRLCPPCKRVDWDNACRDKTITLFGRKKWVALLSARILDHVKRYNQ